MRKINFKIFNEIEASYKSEKVKLRFFKTCGLGTKSLLLFKKFIYVN